MPISKLKKIYNVGNALNIIIYMTSINVIHTEDVYDGR